MKTICLLLSFLLLTSALTGQNFKAEAQSMTNGTYKVEGGNFNSFSGKAQNSEGKKVEFTSGETGTNVNTNQRYKVKAGFQYIKDASSFSPRPAITVW